MELEWRKAMEHGFMQLDLRDFALKGCYLEKLLW
jgi:hypothetical protein